MTFEPRGGLRTGARLVLGLFFSVVVPHLAHAQEPCDLTGPAAVFPRIPLCAFAGAYRDSSIVAPNRCVGSFTGPMTPAVEERARTISLRFRRDRRVEARPDFGGYRIYRVQNYSSVADTSRMVLIRRYSRQPGDEIMWNFSVVDTSLNFRCKNTIVNDSIVTFIDSDSTGYYARVCRRRDPQNDPDGRCLSPGDSVLILKAPPGPHDGFRTWYTITYEAKNSVPDGTYSDLFIPDTLHCATPQTPQLCPNLNNRLLNLMAEPVEPTAGPTANLERVIVVPNPFRASAPWDSPVNHEVHFLNLPSDARIKIYTVNGDLVAELAHTDKIRDFERWDLKNASGQDVSSGIYLYRVEASTFTFQDRFIVIR